MPKLIVRLQDTNSRYIIYNYSNNYYIQSRLTAAPTFAGGDIDTSSCYHTSNWDIGDNEDGTLTIKLPASKYSGEYDCSQFIVYY